MAEPKLESVAYVSAESSIFRDEDLEAILDISRRNNAGRGLTGLLIYGSRCFAQMLEGPGEAIDRLLGKLARDPRHQNMRIVSRGAVDGRSFDSWSMGLQRLNARAEARRLSQVMGQLTAGSADPALVEELRSRMVGFYRVEAPALAPAPKADRRP